MNSTNLTRVVAQGGSTATNRGYLVGYAVTKSGRRQWYAMTPSSTLCRVSRQLARDIALLGNAGVYLGGATLREQLNAVKDI